MSNLLKKKKIEIDIFDTNLLKENKKCLLLQEFELTDKEETYNVAECKVEYVCDEYIILNDIDNLYSARRIDVEDIEEGYYELEFDKSKFEEIINNAMLVE